MSSIGKFFLLLLLTGISAEIWGQAAPTPFSTFGIGERYGSGLVYSQGMAGVGIGTPQFWHINNQNPSLLIYNTTTVFEIGALYESRRVRSADQSEANEGGNLTYLATSFPIKTRRWTSSVGLMPYTDVNYNLAYVQDIENSSNTVTITEEGSGGLNQLYWSNGVRLYKNLAAGIKASYIFGSAINQYTNTLNETNQGVPSTISVEEKTYVTDFNFSFGVSYLKDSLFNGDYRFTVGAVYEIGTNLRAKHTRTFERLDPIGNLIEGDTLVDRHGQLSLPSDIGLGFSLARGYKWIVGLDLNFQDWSTFKSVSDEDEVGMESSWRIGLGGEYTPDIYAIKNYLSRMTYRAGVSYEKTPFVANGNSVNDFGINFGFSLPTGRSSLDLAFKVGKRGSRSENNLEENYFKVYFGLTINDQWFIKRKFD